VFLHRESFLGHVSPQSHASSRWFFSLYLGGQHIFVKSTPEGASGHDTDLLFLFETE
jgi:hypothetical protein